ncbi:MAG: hypothetical protein H0U70_07705 [Tatlockia sp.]|nr:hypothetical protein [Tatlockia sp.]
MVCIIEFGNPPIRFDFCHNKYKQKAWIDALLKYSKLDLESLAKVIEIPPKLLSDVYKGKSFLSIEPANNLAQLFLLAFSD